MKTKYHSFAFICEACKSAGIIDWDLPDEEQMGCCPECGNEDKFTYIMNVKTAVLNGVHTTGKKLCNWQLEKDNDKQLVVYTSIKN